MTLTKAKDGVLRGFGKALVLAGALLGAAVAGVAYGQAHPEPPPPPPATAAPP